MLLNGFNVIHTVSQEHPESYDPVERDQPVRWSPTRHLCLHRVPIETARSPRRVLDILDSKKRNYLPSFSHFSEKKRLTRQQGVIWNYGRQK